MNDRKTGTREWAEHNVNVCKGCSNACIYCYARAAALRFGRIEDGEEWGGDEEILTDKVTTYANAAPKKDGRVMFPTTHDITPTNEAACLITLRGLLEAGNEVLVTTKGDPGIVKRCCVALKDFKDQMMWRFTITHIDKNVGDFWEPNAPTSHKRLGALIIARAAGFETSVSMEPLLQPEGAELMVRFCEPHVTDTVWIGKMRNVRQRTAWLKDEDGNYPPEVLDRIEGLEAAQMDDKVRVVYGACKHFDCVRWKDSYQKTLGVDQYGNAKEGGDE